MTAQEQQLIDELVDRIRNTSVQGKDTEAEEHLHQGLANSPDALYILAQTVIVQKYGLEQAQQRMQAMQAELDSLRGQSQQQAPKPSGGSFLSHIFGGGAQQDQPQQTAQSSQGGWQPVSAPTYSQPGYGQPGYPPQAYPQQANPQQGYPQPGYAPGGYPPPGYGQPSGLGGGLMGGGGGFLHGALQTAAGVAMGEMAMESIGSLFHGFGGGGFGRGFEGDRPSETIINNYEDHDEHRHEDSRDRDVDSSFYNPHNDASRDSDAHGFADSSLDTSDTGSDDSSDDDSDDAGDFDSGDDDGGGDDNY